SAHVGDAIPLEDKKAIEDVACYIVRNPLSLKKLVYLDGQKAVLYRSRMNPSLGRNFEAMDPLEWLARLADHIPDAGKHRTHFYAHFYAHYANRVRGERPSEELGRQKHEEEQPKKRRCSSIWAQLIAEVMPALSHGWWKGWRGPKPLTADFRDRGRGFNALSVTLHHWRRPFSLGGNPTQHPCRIADGSGLHFEEHQKRSDDFAGAQHVV